MSEAAAAGTTRIRIKMATAVDLAALHGPATVDRALGQAAAAGRFAENDLAAILAHQATTGALNGGVHRAGDGHTLAQGTAGWARLTTATSATDALNDDALNNGDAGDAGDAGAGGASEATR